MMEVEICVFCYKIKDGVENGANICFSRFANLLEKFTSEGKKLYKNGDNDNLSKSWGCCDKCRVIADDFCEDFHKLKCLEMKMEWKLQRLLGIMDLAGRVPSRWFKLQQIFQNRSLSQLKNYRSKIIKRCNGRISNLQPRVMLERTEQLPMETETNGPDEPSKLLEHSENNDTIAGTNWPETPTFYGLNVKVEPEESPIPFEEFTNDPLENEAEGQLELGDCFVSKIKVENNANNDPKVYNCPKCSLEHKTEKKLRRHVQVVHDEFLCSECGQLFKTWYLRQKHITSTHSAAKPAKWICKVCGRSFIWKCYLKEHLKTVHVKGTPDIPCKICKKMFLTKNKMSVHMSLVHVEATNQCPNCPKSFKTKRDLRTHQLLHEDREKWKFKCELCDKRFYMNCFLQAHMKSHDSNNSVTVEQKNGKSVKKFECPECGKISNCESNHHFHMLTHEKKTVDSPFETSLALQQHIQLEQGVAQNPSYDDGTGVAQ